MKNKIIFCLALLTASSLLASCDNRGGWRNYPDILSVKEEKQSAMAAWSNAIEEEYIPPDCPHENVKYNAVSGGHRLFCLECRQPIAPEEPHVNGKYAAFSSVPLDEKFVNIFAKTCSVCGTQTEYLLSLDFHGEYRGDMFNEEQP